MDIVDLIFFWGDLILEFFPKVINVLSTEIEINILGNLTSPLVAWLFKLFGSDFGSLGSISILELMLGPGIVIFVGAIAIKWLLDVFL